MKIVLIFRGKFEDLNGRCHQKLPPNTICKEMSPRHSPRFRNRPLQRLVKLLNADFGDSVGLGLGLVLLGAVDLIFLGIVHLEQMHRNSHVLNSG